jgi:exopolysaccharide biosynthesis polyprenyl glycosylphosphotransferase
MNSAKNRNNLPYPVNSVLALIGKNKGVLLALLDFLSILSIFILSYYIRAHLSAYFDFLVKLPEIDQYLKAGVLLGVTWTFLIWRDGGYQPGIFGISASSKRLRSLISCGIYALCGLMVISFLYRGMLLSRTVYLMAGFFSGIVLVMLRSLFGRLDLLLFEKGIISRRIVIAGMSEETKRFISVFGSSGTGGEISGIVTVEQRKESDFDGHRVLGNLSGIEEIYKAIPFDILIIPPQEQTHMEGKEYGEKIIRIVNFCEEENIFLYMQPGSYDVSVSKHEVGNFSGIPLIQLRDTSLHPAYAILKRVMDLCIAVTVLIAGLPFWLLIAVLVKAGSRGPVFYTQVRAGFHGGPFSMYKFRSMRSGAEESLKELIDVDSLEEPVFKIKNDPRVTAVGRFLRRTGLDEIPQLVNVIKGEMSIIGPRPEELAMVEKYTNYQRRRLKAKPGITGYQQINNRGEVSLSERIKYDLIYLKYQGLMLDLYILYRTVIVVITGKGVTH